MTSSISNTPKPPYYAVIFTSLRSEGDNGYSKMAQKMIGLAAKQDGFLGIESARAEIGITVSYWKDLAAIKNWRTNSEHIIAKQKGKEKWYIDFKTRIALVEREY